MAPEDNAIVVSKELYDHYEEVLEFKNGLLNKDTLAKNTDIIASLNAVTKVLIELTKLLDKAHNAENFAQTKQILITTLKDTDIETAELYLEALREKELA